MHQTAARRCLEATLAGELPLAALGGDESVVLNAELDASIQARAGTLSFGEVLASKGLIIVVLDDDGAWIEYRPDGTCAVVEPPATAG
jgi:hypothetical protein